MNSQDNDPIEALRSELKRVPLSPEFAARLRQRIDETPAMRGGAWLTGWRWLVPVAAAAAVVVVAVSVSRPRTDAPAPVVVAARSAAARTAPVSQAPAPVAPTAPPQSLAPDRPTRVNAGVRTSTASTSGRRVSTPAAAAAAQPALEVITNQPALYRALWARAGKGPSAVEVTAIALPEAVPEIVVPPIEVSPIVVKPLGDPVGAPGALPIVR